MSQNTRPLDVLEGRLHIFVAFDWGDAINLGEAGRHAASVVRQLPRRSRTPPSIAYRPPPLRFPLSPVQIPPPWPADLAVVSAEAAVFDFGAVSLTLQVPFKLSPDELRKLARRLADQFSVDGQSKSVVMDAARQVLQPLYERIESAIDKPTWQEQFWEEYLVFQLTPRRPLDPDTLLSKQTEWLAGLLRLEDQPLSKQEIREALRLVLRYGLDDLFVPDWGAAFLLDYLPDCEETLQTIEFANVQLLEYRHIDGRLDQILSQADELLRQASHSHLAFWRGHYRSLQRLGELKVEANGLFERTGNALKLLGDQYLARVYRLLATRFHLPGWEKNIQRKLDVLEGIYEVISQQSSAFRTEFLEAIVILLISVEIILALVRH